MTLLTSDHVKVDLKIWGASIVAAFIIGLAVSNGEATQDVVDGQRTALVKDCTNRVVTTKKATKAKTERDVWRSLTGTP